MVFVTNNKELEKIDQKDKKIITYLRTNGELSRKKLAKELNIAEPNLNYRIQKLQDKNIIHPMILFNFRKIGFKHYNILIDRIEKEELKILETSNEVSVILETFGSKKIILEVITKDLNLFLERNLSNKKVKIIELLNDSIHNPNPFYIKLNLNLINMIEKPISFQENLKLDKIDSKIILELVKQPLFSILALSNQTNLNRQTIKNHLEKLTNSNFIYKKIFAINAFTLGFEEYFLKISITPSLKNQTIKLLKQNPNITLTSESYQEIVTYIQVPNYQILAKEIEKLENISKDIIIEPFQILNYIKVENIPSIVEDELNNII